MIDPESQDIIGEFVKAAAESGGDDNSMHALWHAVMGLDAWHFMSTPITADVPVTGNGSPTPVVGTIPEMPDKKMLFAYSDDKRAWQAMIDNGYKSTGDGFATISMPVKNAAKYAHDLQQHGVYGILFNHSKEEQGFFAPLINVAPMFEYHVGFVIPGIEEDRPAPDFDSIANAFRQNGAEHALHAYLRCLFYLDKWTFVADKSNPGAPMLWPFGEEIALVGFTDQQHAAHAAEQMGILDESGHANILEVTPAEASEFFDTARPHGVNRIVFNPSTAPFPVVTEALQRVIATM